MKAPVYSERELPVLTNADRIVARVHVNGGWKEQEFFADPALGETTVRQVLARVQHALRHLPSGSKGICLYAGAVIEGERCIAALPAFGDAPDQLRRD